MSVKIMHLAWQVDGLDPTQKLVLLKLADNANETDFIAWPSIETIAKQVGCSTRTVQRHLGSLEQLGLIRRKNQFAGNGRQKANLYYVLHPELVGCQSDTPDIGDTHEGDTHDTPITLNHQEPSLPTSTARGTRLPANWFPEPLENDFIRKHGITQDIIQNEFEKFTDYWTAVPGAKGRKLDWQATWRTWLRKAMEYRPRGKPVQNQRKSAMRNTMDAIEEYFSNDRRENETDNRNAPDGLAFFER